MESSNIQHKDRFLDGIASSLGRTRRTSVKRPTWNHQTQLDSFQGYSLDQLIEVLHEQCGKIHTHVEHTKIDTLPIVLERIVRDLQAHSIVSWDDQRIEQYGLAKFYEWANLNGIDMHIWNILLGEKNIKISERADIGITFSDITLAESGTVVLFSDKGKARSVSLLPKFHIVIIPKSSIVPRMTQAMQRIKSFEQEQGFVPSCINFISGPSNSADIEMNLVVGVHGPLKAIYLIVDDA